MEEACPCPLSWMKNCRVLCKESQFSVVEFSNLLCQLTLSQTRIDAYRYFRCDNGVHFLVHWFAITTGSASVAPILSELWTDLQLYTVAG